MITPPMDSRISFCSPAPSNVLCHRRGDYEPYVPLLLAIMLAPTVVLAGDDWPDGPNKRFSRVCSGQIIISAEYQDKHLNHAAVLAML